VKLPKNNQAYFQ